MTGPKKHVVFDAVGTCVGYEAFAEAIDSQLGDKLRSHDVQPTFLAFSWIEVAEREYTYLSLSGRYAPFSTLLRSLFYRLLLKAGIPDPRSFATDEDLEVIMKGYSSLRCRDGVKEMFEKLRAAGWNCWIFTAGDRKRVKGYFDAAGVPMPNESIFTCDDIGIGKPDLRAYKPILETFAEEDTKYFFAAHNWDVTAATTVGFKGAYCSVYEGEPCYDIFGKVGVTGATPLETALNLIKAEE